MRNRLIVLSLLLVPSPSPGAGEPVSKERVQETIAAIGGEAKLLKLFRIKERIIVEENPNAKGVERISVMEPPRHWWVGKKERVKEEKEPATYLVWAWTLGPLLDPTSTLEALSEIKIGDRPAYGIQISGSIDPPMAMYFDRESKHLVRIDWRKDQNVFSEWRELDGLKYPARCSGFKPNGKAWYHTEILELERLNELPAGLSR